MSSLRTLLGMGDERADSAGGVGKSGVVGSGDVIDLGSGETTVVRSVVHVGAGAVCVLDDGESVRLMAVRDHRAVEMVKSDLAKPNTAELVVEGGMWRGETISVWRDPSLSNDLASDGDGVWVLAGGDTWVAGTEHMGAQVLYLAGPDSD